MERGREEAAWDVDEGSTLEEREASISERRRVPLARPGWRASAASAKRLDEYSRAPADTALDQSDEAAERFEAVKPVHRAAGTLTGGTACAAHSSLASSP